MLEWVWMVGQMLGRRGKPLCVASLASALGLLLASAGVEAQAGSQSGPAGGLGASQGAQQAPAKVRKQQKAMQAAQKQAPQPRFSIPVTPLGFAAPPWLYFGERFAVVSLNFLDEDNLLFTFRVPGLIAREKPVPGQTTIAERHIRAVRLALPSGEVKADSVWVLHDYSRYLWPMRDGKFLLRDRNELKIGDAQLHLEPFLRFPGQVNSVQFDPGQHLLITDTTETPAADAGPTGTAAAGPASQVPGTPATAQANMTLRGSADPESDGSGPEAQRLVRILRMDTRQVMLFSHTSGSVHLPVDGEGYYDALRAGESKWLVAFEYFTGSSQPIGLVDSVCAPNLDALAPGIVLASACLPNGARHLTAFARDREKDHARLWDLFLSPTKVWPHWATSGDGMRFARSTLEVSHPIGIYSPLDDSDVRGQSVQVYDLATGAVQLTAPLSPVLDGGGNFALSPSGRRLAVLFDGAIQVFDLGPVAALPPVPAAAPPKAAARP